MSAAFSTDFEPDFASAGEWAAVYRQRGIQVIPCYYPNERPANWKRPMLAEWVDLQEALVPDATFASWYGQDGRYAGRDNMGLITGRASGNVFVIDLDSYKNGKAAEWWQSVLYEFNYGEELETWKQVTGGGGRQIFFRARPDWHAPTNKCTAVGIDIRGQGGFAVLPASVHDSGRRYAWEPGCAPWEIDCEDAPEWLLGAVEDLVEAHGGDKGGGRRLPTERRASLGQTNAFGKLTDGREDYMTRLVWGAVVNWYRECPIKPTDAQSDEKALEVYQTYEREVASNLTGMEKSVALNREGRGAAEFQRKWRYAMKQWDTKVSEAAMKPKPEAKAEEPRQDPHEPETDPETGKPARAISIRPAFPIIASELEPRDWIVPGLLLRKHLSVLVAPPGSGKSLLTLQLAIMCGHGENWSGWSIRKRSRVLVINAEDDWNEMRRRLVAAASCMGVSQHDVRDHVFLADDPDSIVIAKADHKTKTVVRTPLQAELIATIIENQIDVIVVDPFAETFEGDENSNSEIKWAGIIWREIARKTGAAVLLVHHTKKYASGMAGDADASRGGGALIGTARIMSTLFVMTEDEASVMNVQADQRTRYVRFDDAKANMSLVTGVARWFEKQSVALPNGRGIIPGDEVGVLVPWKPPGLLAGVEMATILAVVDTIDRGVLDEDGNNIGYFTQSANGTNKARWAGSVIARMLACDDARAKKILREWVANGVFEEFDYSDTKATRKGLRAVPANRPGRVEK